VAIELARRRFLLSALAVPIVSCRNTHQDLSAFTEEEPAHLLSAVQVGDPHSAPQLLSGWHRIEADAWRWTARKFSVALRPPPGSPMLGAVLQFRFTLPEIVIRLLASVTLSASLPNLQLLSKTYDHIGDALYAASIAPGVLVGDSVRVDFLLDKAILPSQADGRELGVIAHSVSLETK